MQRQLARAFPQGNDCVPSAARGPLMDACYAEGPEELEDELSPDPVDAHSKQLQLYYIKFFMAGK